MENMDSYFATIDELVHDQNKVVTYKFLASQLALSALQAKGILKLYAKNNENLAVVYLLTGKTSKGIGIYLVKDEDLKKAKTNVESVISCYPYSVQKVKLSDASPLYAADLDFVKQVLHQYGRFASIKFNGAHKLSDEEIRKVKEKQRSTTSSQANTADKKTNEKKTVRNVASMFAGKTNSSDKKEPVPAKSPPTQTVETNKSANSFSSLKDSHSEAVVTRKNKGMACFMTNGKVDLFASKRKESATLTTQPETQLESRIDTFEEETADNSEKPMENVEEGSETKTQECEVIQRAPSVDEKKQPETRKRPSKNKTRKQTQNGSRQQPVKKRRRIQEFSSSEDEESSDEQDIQDFDVIPPSPKAAEPVVSEIRNKSRRKKRVLRSKTYIDEEGSMVTDKKWEEVSCSSEDEQPVARVSLDGKPKTNNTSVSKSECQGAESKKSSTKKQKQSSIMGFFSKKS